LIAANGARDGHLDGAAINDGGCLEAKAVCAD
jgi:hypothetical protein